MKFQDHPLEDLKSSLSVQKNHHETDRDATSLSGQVAKIAAKIPELIKNSEVSATNKLNDALSEKRRKRVI